MKTEEVAPFLGKERAAKFSQTGIKFLGLRSRGPKKDLSNLAIQAYVDGKFSKKITQKANKEWAPVFGFEDRLLTEEEMLIIVLGRPPRSNKDGTLVQEASKIWEDGSQRQQVAYKIAEAIGLEHPYINKRRTTAETEAPETTEEPAKAAASK